MRPGAFWCWDNSSKVFSNCLVSCPWISTLTPLSSAQEFEEREAKTRDESKMRPKDVWDFKVMIYESWGGWIHLQIIITHHNSSGFRSSGGCFLDRDLLHNLDDPGMGTCHQGAVRALSSPSESFLDMVLVILSGIGITTAKNGKMERQGAWFQCCFERRPEGFCDEKMMSWTHELMDLWKVISKDFHGALTWFHAMIKCQMIQHFDWSFRPILRWLKLRTSGSLRPQHDMRISGKKWGKASHKSQLPKTAKTTKRVVEYIDLYIYI